MIHYLCKNCKNYDGFLCKEYSESDEHLYDALKNVECKIFSSDIPVLYEIVTNIKYDVDKDETYDMHVVCRNHEMVTAHIEKMNNAIKHEYKGVDGFKIINTVVNPILKQSGYYVELKPVEYIK